MLIKAKNFFIAQKLYQREKDSSKFKQNFSRYGTVTFQVLAAIMGVSWFYYCVDNAWWDSAFDSYFYPYIMLF